MPVQFSSDPLPINPGERHVPVVLLVDNSSSMLGDPMSELNQGLIEFGQALQNDSLALGRAEVCVISFNSTVQIEMSFRPATEYQAPVLKAGGATALNEAIDAGLDMIENRKSEYRAQGIAYYRPWLFVLTDGAPTDISRESGSMSRLQHTIESKKVVYMPMGIGANADIRKLQQYYPDSVKIKPVLKAEASNFKEAFVWLSNSIAIVSHSDPEIASEVSLPPVPENITLSVGIN